MKTFLLLFIGLFTASNYASGQNELRILVKDAVSNEGLPDVSIVTGGKDTGTITNAQGYAFLKVSGKEMKLHITCIGYKPLDHRIYFPLTAADTLFVFALTKEEHELEQVIVSSSRTESRIENLPTKVEVLGVEEVNEEVGIKPGNIASLLGDIAGIQTQQTSTATGNTEMRVQGLPGKYTQLLKDGMPLFGGYAGSFSVLQIPPLDLKQIEIIKGASSTLYGGGAIAGMINLVSKRPRIGKPERTILLNQSTLNETNAHVYFSARDKKSGYSFFSGINRQQAKDVNHDGFSDLARTNGFYLHPVIFLYPDEKNLVSIGYNGTFEKRKGGDMLVLQQKTDAVHQYFVENKSIRNNLELVWENKISKQTHFNFKATGSWLQRDINTNVFGMSARQFSYFSEASWLHKLKKHDLVTGINLNGDHFRKQLPDSTQIPDEQNNTVGLFIQDDWKISSRFIVQSGLRTDYHNRYGSLLLPRMSLLYKISPVLTTRLGGGLGYKTPSLFSSELDERDYMLIRKFGNIRPEKSGGMNWDINYHAKLNNWELTINQTFYFTTISRPVQVDINTLPLLYFKNAAAPLRTKGFETYFQAHYNKLEIYLGYTYTYAVDKNDPAKPFLSLSARNKFASVLAYEFSDHFRGGIESAFTGKQYLDDGSQTPAYPFVAAMFRYDTGPFSFVLNCENLLDYRQTRKENIILPPLNNPRLRQLWAPIDGRVVNLSIRVRI